mmetsp:Transcript_18228/g.49044  ORF Transcript_18228/g.49044 Transcript_18228/m.49044 type:complete len:219 (-) Transcript_18228:191-847(-)
MLGPQKAARAALATRSWVASFVCGLGLCPWARPHETLYTVAPHAADQSRHIEYMRRQANLLCARAGPHAHAEHPTVLCAFTTETYVDVTVFAALWRDVQENLAGQSIVLLAFHPVRLDRGPGCFPDEPHDPGHFTVRSPLPTLQLLRKCDVDEARLSWEKSKGGKGALGLLLENKDSLRALGSSELSSRMHKCSQLAADTSLELTQHPAEPRDTPTAM